jgi:hypothetical protein
MILFDELQQVNEIEYQQNVKLSLFLLCQQMADYSAVIIKQAIIV